MSLNEEQIRNLQGLSEKDAEYSLKKYGYNELPSSKKRNIFKIIFEVMKEPMFMLLVACGLLYFFLGDYQEAILLLGFVFVIMGITIYQEGKTEKALDALKDLSSPRALVIRDGERKRIAGREVVQGDYIILSEGDRVPADGVTLWCLNLSVDESLLTGESASVSKSPSNESTAMERPGGENKPFIYSGTLVIQGQGIALIKSTGINTEMGKIGKAMQEVKEEQTLIQKETGKIVKITFVIAAVLCAVLVIVYGLTKGDWIKAILSGITLAMAMLPEEFPVVLTIFLAIGAWRISKKNVLTRKVSAVETLGAATVLCVDKTGTLTENKMTVKKIFANNDFYNISQNKDKELPEAFHDLIEYGMLASKKDPFDPMEKALSNLGVSKLKNTEHIHHDWEFIHEYPLSKELLALSHVWLSSKEKDQYTIAAKGAPEAIFDLCHFNKDQISEYSQKISVMAEEGLRVLGVAKALVIKKDLPKAQHDFDFKFIGLIGLEDPIRETVPPAIKECYKAGIRVVMITGDYPVTAQNIAKQIGLNNPENVITGSELNGMSESELRDKIKTVNVFARVVPEQKLILVNAFKANKEIVSMTGDGVNDAPALRSSHIGIAMGERGTDVAREASNLVLLKDDFSSIVAAVRTGRRIFDNLKKAMSYIISVHMPIAGLSIIPVLMQWKEMILFPVHVVFLELIIDPACSIVFECETEEKNIMDRKPRRTDEGLFNLKNLIISVIQGLAALGIVLGVNVLSKKLGQTEAEARTLTFITLIISNLCMILTNRSGYESIFASFRRKNSSLLWIILAAVSFLGLVIYVPFLRDLCHFSFMHMTDIIISAGAGVFSIIIFEIIKKTIKVFFK